MSDPTHFCEKDWHGGELLPAYYMVSQIQQSGDLPLNLSMVPDEWATVKGDWGTGNSACCCVLHLNKTIAETFNFSPCAVVTIHPERDRRDEY